MWKITNGCKVFCSVMIVVALMASHYQDKKYDAELAARRASAPVLNSNLAWLSK